MTELDLNALRAKAEAADAVAPTGWEADRERMTDTPYKHHEFFAIDGAGNRMFGTENADAGFGLIEVEDDGDGFVAAWNENSRRVIEFTVAAQPRVVLALLDRVEKTEFDLCVYDNMVKEGLRLIDARDAEIARLRALLVRAGSALKPFGEEADQWLDTVPDAHRSLCTEPGSDVAIFGSETAFTLGDLRIARTISREIEEAIGHE